MLMRNNNLKIVNDKWLWAKKVSSYTTFRQGCEDIYKSREWDKTYDLMSKADQIAYEWGRGFALNCKLNCWPRPQWRKGVLAKTAQERLISSWYSRAIH
jgi:hypothetical protein